MLWLVLRTIEAGQPFDRGNPRRLAVLAALVLAGGTMPGIAAQISSAVVRAHVGLSTSAPLGAPPLQLEGLAIAMLLLVGAYAFRRGAQLSDDVAGLV